MNKPNPLALITGASAGIGAELARVFCANGYDLILVARNETRLQALAESLRSQHDHLPRIEIISVDLAKAKGVRQLCAHVDDMGVSVDTLVNNAGSAYQGRFADMSLEQSQQMLQLNTRSLVELTHRLLPQMRARKAGRILNVASVVGFQAVPSLALYAATKAFVVSFSESLSEELRNEGITVTALCPGLTRTDMVSDLGTDRYPGAQLIMSDAASVAREGFRAVHAGEAIRIPGFFNQLVVNWAEYQPRWLKRGLAGMAARASPD